MKIIDQLLATVAHLRSPEGCAWDRAQTHESLQSCLIEEAAEVLQAIADQKDAFLLEELGDLLLQVLLHAQIASERGAFSLEDIANYLHKKLIRRHPHVFGDAPKAETHTEALARWRSIKAEEKAAKGLSPDEEEPLSPTLSGLLYASKSLSRLEKRGKLKSHSQAEDALNHYEKSIGTSEMLGMALLNLVKLARYHNWDPELALRDAVNHEMRSQA